MNHYSYIFCLYSLKGSNIPFLIGEQSCLHKSLIVSKEYLLQTKKSCLLRPFLLVNFPEARQVRRAFRTIRRSLPDLINVLILFMASLSLFSVMANKLFEKRDFTEKNYLSNFFDTFWEFYVLVTTANSPDIMMPAYNANRCFHLQNSHFFAIYRKFVTILLR